MVCHQTMSGMETLRTGTTTGAHNGWGTYMVARVKLNQTMTDTGEEFAANQVNVVAYNSPLYDVALFTTTAVTTPDPLGGEPMVVSSTSVSQPGGVGVNERERTARFDVFPNPATSTLNFDLSGLEGNKQILVLDATSRTVLHTSTAGQRMRWQWQ